LNSVEFTDFSVDDVSKQEDEGIECLVLRGCCNVATNGKLCEE